MRLLLLACCGLAACTPGPGNDTLSAEDNAVINIDAIDSARDQGVAAPVPEPTDPPTPGIAGDIHDDGTPVNVAAPAPRPTVDNRSTARYRCIDGGRLVARFDPDNAQVTVLRGNKQLAVLTQQRAASGIAYSGGGYELRAKGYDMTFTAPGQPPIPCTVIR
jgi:membrane-bound inhibitor of C-type lysozyme